MAISLCAEEMPASTTQQKKLTVEDNEQLNKATAATSTAKKLSVKDKYAETEQEHRAVLAIQERVLGAEHPDVLQSCASLARCLYNQKKLPEALAFIQRAETGYAKVPELGRVYSTLNEVTRELIEAKMRKP